MTQKTELPTKLMIPTEYCTEHEARELERRAHRIDPTAMSRFGNRIRVTNQGTFYVLVGPPWCELVKPQVLPFDEGMRLLLSADNPEEKARTKAAADALDLAYWQALPVHERAIARLVHNGDKQAGSAWERIQSAIATEPEPTVRPAWAKVPAKPFVRVFAKSPSTLAKVKLVAGENILTRADIEAIAAHDTGRSWLAAGHLRIVAQLDKHPNAKPATVGSVIDAVKRAAPLGAA